MSEFTVFDVPFPPAAKQRVIVNTDAKNEADDQYAIVHAILTPSFDLHGIIPAHFGTAKSTTSMQDSYDETMLLLRLMGIEDQVRVEAGATHVVPHIYTSIVDKVSGNTVPELVATLNEKSAAGSAPLTRVNAPEAQESSTPRRTSAGT